MGHKSIPYWNNKTNKTYYENIPLRTQAAYAKRGGLEDYSDLKVIKNYIDNADSILELGACYGRVLDYLLDVCHKKNVTAIERSQQFYALLAEKYHNRAHIIHADIATFISPQHFDLLLWMWSGLTDFQQYEQGDVIKHLAQLLQPQGVMIIDTFPHDIVPLNASDASNQAYSVCEGELCTLHGYVPSPECMQEYATAAGFKNCDYKPYLTSANRPRVLYVLQDLR